MYDIIDLYEKPYDKIYPVTGFDEKPKQNLEDERQSIPMIPDLREKFDYEYVRKGTARVTSRRTKRGFAKFIKQLVDRRYPEAEQLQIVLDNLNTHDTSALYEVYGSQEAKRLLQKIQFHHTPAHASWLNVAEIEIGAIGTECRRKRIPEKVHYDEK
ncbi:MAG: transposase [Candidatus Methanospirareceae archaeon]